MEKEMGSTHILVLPYPSQGHINPMHQFSKRLVSKGLKATFVLTNFISKGTTTQPPQSTSIHIDTISDGYDEGGFAEAESVQAYLASLKANGSRTLAELIERHKGSDHPIDCVVYDAFLPWALDVAKEFGLVAASFFTQNCAINYIYYYAHSGLLTLPVSSSSPVEIPGLPELELADMPSFIHVYGSYPDYFELVLNQFSNVDKADYVLVNTFYKLEDKVVDAMSKVTPMLTIGPSIPSFYLDKQLENDNDYSLNLFNSDSSYVCTNWLSTKPPGSVVYVSFGSMASLDSEQMEELACGLKRSGCYFLWVVRTSEEAKLPEKFKEETSDKGLFVQWSPQLLVLSDVAVGCFFSHCGWNSTIEALSLGVPMVAMPQWTDQTTNAKLVQDVWKVGVRVKAEENGLVGRNEVEACIREVMEGERAKAMKKNAIKWKSLAKEAVSEGGTTDLNINQFVSELSSSKYCS